MQRITMPVALMLLEMSRSWLLVEVISHYFHFGSYLGLQKYKYLGFQKEIKRLIEIFSILKRIIVITHELSVELWNNLSRSLVIDFDEIFLSFPKVLCLFIN